MNKKVEKVARMTKSKVAQVTSKSKQCKNYYKLRSVELVFYTFGKLEFPSEFFKNSSRFLEITSADMSIILSNQEPMALTKYIETYFKDTTPDIHLFSQDNFEIPIHKELFYQTRLMRSMIKSANFDYCCSKASVLCPMSREELEMIVQFLYGGKLFCKNQEEAAQVSENLKKLFGFPQIHLNQDLKPEIEDNSSLISENYDLDLKALNDKKKSRKQSFNSGSIRHELIEDVIIKTETKDSCVETNFPGHYLAGYNDENISEDPLDSKIKVEAANKNDNIDITKSDIICSICNKKLISKHALACHVIRKHKVPSIYYVIIFRGKRGS